MMYHPIPLPPSAEKLCRALAAPPRLVAHLTLVHDAANSLVVCIRKAFPVLVFDSDSVLFGAATHDLGKCRHQDELVGPGTRHEEAGPELLESEGVPPNLARFTKTHGSKNYDELPLEDLLVSLADTIWKGQRLEALELKIVSLIALQTGMEAWEVFASLDTLLQDIASQGDERLDWQRRG